jgi:hypothetical protein
MCMFMSGPMVGTNMHPGHVSEPFARMFVTGDVSRDASRERVPAYSKVWSGIR